MNSGIGKCGKIRHIVRLRQLLKRWRQKAALTARITHPTDVPAGHVAITVGSSCRRFVIRATYLNHPVLKRLLVQAQEEYGFSNQGPLCIPCDESLFEDIIRFISRSDSYNSARFCSSFDDFQRNCNSRRVSRPNLHLDSWSAESRPLLPGPAEKSIWY